VSFFIGQKMLKQTQNWRPSASIETLKARAKIIQKIRHFFEQKDVLEVDTPALSHATVTDQHLHSFATQFNHPMALEKATLYLQTSPEFAMKRLLCAGSGAIFQICKAFRDEESGQYHNPEFTMLEWYRPDFDHHQLMTEIDELLCLLLKCEPAERVTYQAVFKRFLQCDPLQATLAELQQLAQRYGHDEWVTTEENRDTLLMLLFSEHVEPHIGQQRPCFVVGFPASQAALAKLNQAQPLVADRFELYFRGFELANGFHELTDHSEQTKRFEQDNHLRINAGLQPMPIEQRLILALKHGLPNCAGVAIGVDRLVMLCLGLSAIEQSMAFDHSRA
jgi:lysyl-tRNA synthetase class 2